MDALATEVRRLGERIGRLTLDTVFIGGGTPSLVDPALLAELVATVRSTFAVAVGAEVTMEANPSSTSASERGSGATPASTGSASACRASRPTRCAFLGRVHDADRAIAAVDEVRAAGFTSINCDLIYAVPGLGDTRWRRTLERVIAAAARRTSRATS